MKKSKKIQSYQEFWPFYLRQHRKPVTRALHYVGTTLALLAAISFFRSGHWAYLVVMLVGSYGFAWVGHFGVEKNKPATFTYPLWSLFSDFRMYALWLSGGIGAELEKAGVK